MEITLQLMSVDQKFLLVQLMELYNYEFTAYSNEDINEYGYYGYGHIDDYWNEKGRFPYLIRVDGKIAGFVLICPHCDYRKEKGARCIGEFFIMLKYRRKGIGSKVVEEYTNNHYQICGAENNKQVAFIFEN